METEESKGSFVITIGENKLMASHMITVEGALEDKWYKPFLTDFIKKKVNTEIDEFWQAEIELLDIRNVGAKDQEVKDQTEIKVAVYIAGVGSSETIKKYTHEWLENHIGGLFRITNLEVKAVSSLARTSDEE